MEPQEKADIVFHSEASVRFNELSEEILRNISSFGVDDPKPTPKIEIHPAAALTSADIVGEIKVQESAVNLLGEEQGRFWNSQGLRVGWSGDGFAAIKALASRFEKTRPIAGRVSHKFLVDEIFGWLKGRLETQRTDLLTEHIAQRCSNEIRDYEIWIPVYRTYSAREFAIGDVLFRTVSKEMLNIWYVHAYEELASLPGVEHTTNRERSAIQGSVAACIKVSAELEKARQIAQEKAGEAIGLLRLLSPVNWTCKLVSHCLPVGRENTQSTVELFVKNGVLENTRKGTIEQGPSGWNIDEARHYNPGLLEALGDLASNREATEFGRDLYGSLLLYSRQSIAAEISHKIVFVKGALESLLLKNSFEPIQKNLGERIAFLIGNNLSERKDIVENVERFYDVRSEFIHHGREVAPADVEVVDKFFVNAWLCLTRLLRQVNQYATKARLIEVLQDRKLS